jgi:hypothetical protein
VISFEAFTDELEKIALPKWMKVWRQLSPEAKVYESTS